jgi:hypothetical protein
MKISVAFCDEHPTSTLSQAETETISPLGDLNTVHTWACTVPGCNRHYRRHIFGYHRLALGEHPQVGDDSKKPKCGWNHEVEFMVLTKIGGILTWACPNEACDRTQPFDSKASTRNMTELENLQATIARERALLQNHEEKLTASNHYRKACERGLGHLRDAERSTEIDDLGVAWMALGEGVKARKKVDDAVSLYGYGVVNPTETLL